MSPVFEFSSTIHLLKIQEHYCVLDKIITILLKSNESGLREILSNRLLINLKAKEGRYNFQNNCNLRPLDKR